MGEKKEGNSKKKIILLFGILIIIGIMYFAYANYTAVFSPTGTNYLSCNERSTCFINLTISNTEASVLSNITAVVINLTSLNTLNINTGNFTFISGTNGQALNGTTNANVLFSNTTNLVNWSNASALIGYTNTSSTLWINTSSPLFPGFYNLTVMIYNSSSVFNYTLRIMVNDTQAPNLSSSNIVGINNYTSKLMNVNISIWDDYNINNVTNGTQYVNVTLWNSTFVGNISTMINQEVHIGMELWILRQSQMEFITLLFGLMIVQEIKIAQILLIS